MTIIETYGGRVSKEYLLELTKTTKNGVNAYSLLEAAKKIGFNTKGLKGDFRKLDNSMLPCIAHVIINKSYQHFIVIHHINHNKKILTIADPAKGIVKYNFQDLDKIATQQYLLFSLQKRLPILEKKNPLLILLFKFLSNNKKIFSTIFILSVLYTLFNIASSLVFKFMIDEGLIRTKTYLINIFIISSFILIFKSFIDLFRNKLLNKINHQLDQTLINHIYSHLISLPYLYYKNKTTGEVLSRINDLSNIKELISNLFLTLFVDSLLIIIVFVFLYLISPLLTFITIIIMLIYIVIIAIYYRFLDKYIHLNYEYSAQINSYLVETLSGYETIKGTNLESFVINKFKNIYKQFSDNSYKFNNLFNIQKFNKDLVNEWGLVFLMFIGCYLVLNKQLTLGSLIAYNSLLIYFFNPIKNIIDLSISYYFSKIAFKRIGELLIIEPEQLIFVQKENKEIDGDISIKHLTYSYNNKDNILNDVNLNIMKGSKVMLYGGSGRGKSTIVKLLLRYFTINKNTIYINKKDINNYNIRELREGINYLSQNEILFTDSIYNNVVLNKKVSDAQFLNAMKWSLSDQIIKDNVAGYNMLLEENGNNLSGGERQRIILARLFLEKKKILIIDEAMSEIDIVKERQILINLFNYYHDATIIYISHRFDNSDIFDQILQLE